MRNLDHKDEKSLQNAEEFVIERQGAGRRRKSVITVTFKGENENRKGPKETRP